MRKLKNEEKNDIATAFSLITSLGINLIVVVGLCLYIGHRLDKFFDTNPVFMIIFIIIGVITAFRNLYYVSMNSVNTKKK